MTSHVSLARASSQILVVVVLFSIGAAQRTFKRSTLGHQALIAFAQAQVVDIVNEKSESQRRGIVRNLTTHVRDPIGKGSLPGGVDWELRLGPCTQVFKPEPRNPCDMDIEVKDGGRIYWQDSAFSTISIDGEYRVQTSAGNDSARQSLARLCSETDCVPAPPPLPEYVGQFASLQKLLSVDAPLKLSVVDVELPVRTALWVLAVVALMLSAIVASTVHAIGRGDDWALDEPWLTIDAVDGLGTCAAAAWFVAIVSAGPIAVACLIYSNAAILRDAGSYDSATASIVCTIVLLLVTVSFSARIGEELIRIREGRAYARLVTEVPSLGRAAGALIAVGLIVVSVYQTAPAQDSVDVDSQVTISAVRSWVTKTKWREIDPIGDAVCGVTDGGAWRCFGKGFAAMPSVAARVLDTAPPDGLFQSVSMTINGGCGIRKPDGTVACFGLAVPGTGPEAKFRVLKFNGRLACGIRNDGQMACWGADAKYWSPPQGTFEELSLATYHACAIGKDEGIVCWGTLVASKESLAAPVGQFRSISVTDAVSCAVRKDGKIQCWGPKARSEAVETRAIGVFVKVAVGGGFSCGLRNDNSVVCWGASGFGQLLVPPERNFRDVVAGGQKACALRADGTVVCWGCSFLDSTCDETGSSE